MYQKGRPLGSFKDGDRVEDAFVVKIKRSMRPYASGFMFYLILSDASGRSVEYSYWGEKNEAEVRKVHDGIGEDDVVLVKGRFRVYNGRPGISTNPPDTIKVLQEGEYDPAQFIKPAKRPVEEMMQELKSYISGIKNAQIRKVLERVFLEDTKFLGRFSTHPGAIEIHHNWTGGLLQHTLEVAKYCELSKNMFPDLDRDMMIAGALLHDIGKMQEIQVTTRIKGTVKGQLKGHIPLGYKMLANVMDGLGTDEMVADKLLHIVLSHHGSGEFGSPKEPMFSEALVVHYADVMSSKLSEMAEFTAEQKSVTENDFMYHARQRKNIYLR